MSNLTPETLAEWRAATEAATEGPWEFEPFIHGDPLVCQVGRGHFGEIAMGSTGWPDYGRANAIFIALTRTAMPALLAEVEQLQARLDAIAAYAGHPGNWSATDGRRRLISDLATGGIDPASRDWSNTNLPPVEDVSEASPDECGKCYPEMVDGCLGQCISGADQAGVEETGTFSMLVETGAPGYHVPVRPLCSQCSLPIPSDDVRSGWGMCGPCVHDARRSGWTPGEGA